MINRLIVALRFVQLVLNPRMRRFEMACQTLHHAIGHLHREDLLNRLYDPDWDAIRILNERMKQVLREERAS